MNGIETKKNFIETLASHKGIKKKQLIKYLFCLVFSHLFLIIFLFIPDENIDDFSKTTFKTELRKTHVSVNIPLKVFLPLKLNQETTASLFNSKNELLIENAFVGEKSTSSGSEFENVELKETFSYYQVQIPKFKLPLILRELSKNVFFKAFPKIKTPKQKKRVEYEIHF